MCVMCGMCLPHCPTYLVAQNEAESPRGRLSLIQAFAQGRLSGDQPSLQAHLEHCLGCMACEAMCPSRVPYGRLLDEYRAATAASLTLSFVERRLLQTVRQPGKLAQYGHWLQASRWLGLDRLASAGLKLLGQPHMARMLKHYRTRQFRPHYPTGRADAPRVGLFSGCMGSSFDSETLDSSIRLLNRLGFDVELPENQDCCGALHQHSGQPEQARQLGEQNRELFRQLNLAHIIFASNGCGAQLRRSLPGMGVSDILSFLLDQGGLTADQLNPCDRPVLLHESCSSLNKLATGGISGKILQRIPHIQLIGFGSARYCCGAGGSHQLTQPALSSRLLELKIDEIRQLKPALLVTDNLGCGLNFKTGLDQAGIKLEVIHPVTLLARQLKDTSENSNFFDRARKHRADDCMEAVGRAKQEARTENRSV